MININRTLFDEFQKFHSRQRMSIDWHFCRKFCRNAIKKTIICVSINFDSQTFIVEFTIVIFFALQNVDNMNKNFFLISMNMMINTNFWFQMMTRNANFCKIRNVTRLFCINVRNVKFKFNDNDDRNRVNTNAIASNNSFSTCLRLFDETIVLISNTTKFNIRCQISFTRRYFCRVLINISFFFWKFRA